MASFFHVLTFSYICFYIGTPDILNPVPDEHNLLEILADIDHQWYVIGSGLKVPYNILVCDLYEGEDGFGSEQ